MEKHIKEIKTADLKAIYDFAEIQITIAKSIMRRSYWKEIRRKCEQELQERSSQLLNFESFSNETFRP